MRTFVALLLLGLLAACATEKKKPLLFTANLPVWTVTVSGKKDTVLRTPKGALLRIRKGTFDGPVQLVVQEAYTLQDMLLGGLTTEAGGRPLASGGMIRISTAAGDDVPLRKPIGVALPTSFIDPKMELYKGVPKGDSIDWVRADTLPQTPATTQIEWGRQVFENNCRTCHSLNVPLTGPALRGVTERGPWTDRNELYKWVHNPARYIRKTAYTTMLWQQYGAIMQSFPQLSNEAIDAVLAYLKNEEANPWDDVSWQWGEDSASGHTAAPEAWCSDTVYFSNPADTLPPPPLDPAVFDAVPEPAPDTQGTGRASAAEMQGLRNGFTDKPGTGAYTFEVETLGWYNIDAEVNGQPGTVPCELDVELLGVPLNHMTVYVFFPAYKDLTVGNHVDGNVVSFRKIDGKIPLYLGAEGVVLAFGSVGDGLYVGTQRFSAARAQRLSVTLKPSSEDAFLDLVRQNRIEGIDLKAHRQERTVRNHPCSDAAPNATDSSIVSDFVLDTLR